MIKGITYRNASNQICKNIAREPMNRDEAVIDYTLLENNNNLYSPFVDLKNYEKEGIKAIPILIARGCTEKCTFCFNNSNGRFRSREITSIIEEINIKRKIFKTNVFWMVDPTFTLREKYSEKLCDAIKKHCNGIVWYCETRSDCSLFLLKKMVDSGCISIDFALESGAPHVLKEIKKRLDLTKLKDFAINSKKLGIRSLVFVMYGLPKETFSDFQETMKLLYELKPYLYTISFGAALILPGTEMERNAIEQNLLPENFSWFDKNSDIPQWKGRMSNEEKEKCYKLLCDFKKDLDKEPLVKYICKTWYNLTRVENKSIILFGGGSHTKFLLEILRKNKLDFPRYILDDNMVDIKIDGVEVISPNAINFIDSDIIILSTDTYPNVFDERCRELFQDIEIIKLYKTEV